MILGGERPAQTPASNSESRKRAAEAVALEATEDVVDAPSPLPQSQNRAWKPGDMVFHSSRGRGIVQECLTGLWVEFQQNDVASRAADVDVRPLVVIDPEDREQVTRLAFAIAERCGNTDGVQAALRSLIEPSRPEEPTGLGAVVESADGELFVRHGIADEDEETGWCDSQGVGRSWARVNAVKVLSEGVQP